MKAKAGALALLREWTARGLLVSQYEAHLASYRASDSYQRMVRRDGKEAVEAYLAKQDAKDRREAYAASIKSTARGFLKLVEKDPDLITVTQANGHGFPLPHNVVHHDLLLFHNGRFDVQIQGEAIDVFGFERTLGLLAVTLMVATQKDGTITTELGLVLASRLIDEGRLVDGYVLAQINQTGEIRSSHHCPGISAKDYLYASLQIRKIDQCIFNGPMSSGFNERTLFPGVVGYIADRLPLLETYLTELADKLPSARQRQLASEENTGRPQPYETEPRRPGE